MIDYPDFDDILVTREMHYIGTAKDPNTGEKIELEYVVEIGEPADLPMWMPTTHYVCNAWVRKKGAPVQYFLLSFNCHTPHLELVPSQSRRHLSTDPTAQANLRNLLPKICDDKQYELPMDCTGETFKVGLFDQVDLEETHFDGEFGACKRMGPAFDMGIPSRSSLEFKIEFTRNTELDCFYCTAWLRVEMQPARYCLKAYTIPVSKNPPVDAWDEWNMDDPMTIARFMTLYVYHMQDTDPLYVEGDNVENVKRMKREAAAFTRVVPKTSQSSGGNRANHSHPKKNGKKRR